MRTCGSLLALLALTLFVVPTEAQRGGRDDTYGLPLPVPDRPFLLAEAEQRFLPSESARLRIEHRGEADVVIEVHRVMDPSSLLGTTLPARSLAFATGPLGAEMERLAAATGSLPRRGNGLALVATSRARLSSQPRRSRASSEQVLYDSYEDEETDVETAGVMAGGWTNRSVSLGALPTGLYIARVTEGAWASSALVSVGALTLLARRGDDHDEVRVVTSEGRPVAGVQVTARVGARVLASGMTDVAGRVELPASDDAAVRFVAIREDDVAWADIAHARMTACDPRVYLGVGRPVFRWDEVMHVRGHVRGCDASGREGPLANETVVVGFSSGGVEVRTDAFGDFVAEGGAGSTVSAEVLGHVSRRDVLIDSRALPDHTLLVVPDRSAVVGGGRFNVRVSDEDGAWPTTGTVRLTVGETTHELPIGPGQPAVFSLTAPLTASILERLPMRAALSTSGRIVFASAEIWTGIRAEAIELDLDRAVGSTGESVLARASIRDLGGTPVGGTPVLLELLPSDGNRPTSITPIASSTASTSAAGIAEGALALTGEGPWWVRARHGASEVGFVLRNRPQPAPLSDRADVAVRLAVDAVAPGEVLDVELSARGGGGAWVTLEQGSVWASQLVEVHGRTAHVSLRVPSRARGLATVVVTQVHGGRTRTASRAIEVRTSAPVSLSVSPSSRTAPSSSTLRVVLDARDARGAPRDAVVSVWMANAGYWDLGEERYPAPAGIFRLPGRPATAGDGATPTAFGSEEGRHLEAHLTWNGVALPGATFRHAWGYGGSLASFDAAGPLGHVVTVLARAAGLRGASFCAETAAELGNVSLSSASLPWDLVATRIAERVELEVGVQDGVLTFPCPGAGSGLGSGFGFGGHGSGVPHIRSGEAGLGTDERELLEGDLFFEGRIVLGADGRAELDIPMPARAGRFRIEALAITDDGGGDRAHAIVHTTQDASVRVELPRVLAVGDTASGTVTVSLPRSPGQAVALAATLSPGLALAEPLPATLVLDEHGEAGVAVQLSATSEGSRSLEVSVTSGAAHDRVRYPIEVLPPTTEQPVAFRALVGPAATDVTIALPPRAGPALLELRLDGDVEHAIESALVELREPRWAWVPVRLDRLEALVALRRAAIAVHGPHARELQRAVEGAVAELLELVSPDGTWGAVPGAPPDAFLTASILIAGEDATGSAGLAAARARLTRAARAGSIEPGALPASALALVSSEPALAEAMLQRARPRDLDAASACLRAAVDLGSAPLIARFRRVLTHQLDDELLALDATDGCRGPAWFACFARLGRRGRLARAAETLVLTGGADSRARAAQVALALARMPSDQSVFAWGRADADLIALVASLRNAARDVRGELLVGERRIALASGVTSFTAPEGDTPVTLRLPADPDRLAFVRVDGLVAVRPEDLPAGDLILTRRFAPSATGTAVEIVVARHDAAGPATLIVPLPAGLELALSAGEPLRVAFATGRPFEWSPVDPRPRSDAPRVEVFADGVHVEFPELPQGVTRLSLPVVPIAHGHFTGGPALVVTRSGGVGSAPPWTIELP